jgi:hypothetical protein
MNDQSDSFQRKGSGNHDERVEGIKFIGNLLCICESANACLKAFPPPRTVGEWIRRIGENN